MTCDHDWRLSNVYLPLKVPYDGLGYRNLRCEVCSICGQLRLTPQALASYYLSLEETTPD